MTVRMAVVIDYQNVHLTAAQLFRAIGANVVL